MLKVLRGSLPRLITWWVSPFSIKRILALFILVYSSYGHDQKENLQGYFSQATLGKFGCNRQKNHRNEEMDYKLSWNDSNLLFPKTLNCSRRLCALYCRALPYRADEKRARRKSLH